MKYTKEIKNLILRKRGASQLANQKGMTLVEIMIVLGILGALMAVLIPMVQSRFRNAQVKQTKLTMSQIVQSINSFEMDCGKYPSSLDGLIKAEPDCNNWGPDPYLKKLPKDSWGQDFVYSADGATFQLKSLGSDRKEGGDGSAKDITLEDLE